MITETAIKVIGITATAIGIGATLAADWVGEKKMNITIEKKVMEALSKIKE